MERVNKIIEKWNSDPDFVIEMMQDIQEEFRFIPEEALETMTLQTKVPLARLYHIATFYKSFSLTPRGKYEIQVCTGTACHVKGAALILDAFARELEIKEGETTPNKVFTLEGVRCLGCCSLAPVITIGDDLYGEVKSADVPKLIKKYKEGNDE
ncbi:MAG: NAD(P)H-dependent oxidoreductase subunit E [Candidatus Cloacimonetes bacterium]|nr:NAD(P)H-dependent oxidoreductase subunit E [Candidatus Cloacimonadota bacterium]